MAAGSRGSAFTRLRRGLPLRTPARQSRLASPYRSSGQYPPALGRRFQPANHRACDATNGGGGLVGASLYEAQQRQARLGFQARLARASIRLLGRHELPFKTKYLCLLVERRGGSPLVDALRTRAIRKAPLLRI